MHDAGGRYYISALGRWNATDPLEDAFPGHSPYNYAMNSPTGFTDPTGMAPAPFGSDDQFPNGTVFNEMNTTISSTHVDETGKVVGRFNDGDLGVYQHDEGISEAALAVCQAMENTSCGGEKVGRTLSWNSFSKGDEIVLNKPGRGGEIVDSYYARAKRAGLYEYAQNAGQKEDFDISFHTGEGGYVSGSNGLIISSRDAGNIVAGLMARGSLASFILATYGQYNLNGVGRYEAVARSALSGVLPYQLGNTVRAYMFAQEDPVSARAILYGLSQYE